MSTPRAEVAGLLGRNLPRAVRVLAYARNIDSPTKDTVMVRLDEVAPATTSATFRRRYTFGLVLIVPSTDTTGKADERLDGLLEDVLHAIEQHPLLSWERAVRATYLDSTLPAYEITASVIHEKETA